MCAYVETPDVSNEYIKLLDNSIFRLNVLC